MAVERASKTNAVYRGISNRVYEVLSATKYPQEAHITIDIGMDFVPEITYEIKEFVCPADEEVQDETI